MNKPQGFLRVFLSGPFYLILGAFPPYKVVRKDRLFTIHIRYIVRMINILVERARRSYDFRADPNKPDSFENNWKNNSLDRIVIRDGDTALCRFRCQTVAHGDTVAPDRFTVRAFVPPRNFHGEIHAITRTRDIDGEWINHEAMQVFENGFQNGRWLIHDRFSFSAGADTAYAWSVGCFIMSSADLAAFNGLLRKLGVKPGDPTQHHKLKP